jgi:hypothetical protein
MEKELIIQISVMDKEGVKKRKEEIKKITIEDIKQLTKEECNIIRKNKIMYHRLKFDVQLEVSGMGNLKSKPFDGTLYCINLLENQKRNAEITESGEVYLEYLKKRWAIMEDLEKNQGMNRLQSTEVMNFALPEEQIWKMHKNGEKIDGYTSEANR